MNRSGSAISSSIAHRSSSNRARRSRKSAISAELAEFGRARRPASDSLRRGREPVRGRRRDGRGWSTSMSSEPRSGSPFLMTVAKSPARPRGAGCRRLRACVGKPLASGGVALVGADQHRGQRIAAARAAHLLERRGVARHPADRRQRLQMLGAGIGRRQQQEDEVDRAAVDRLVVERLGTAARTGRRSASGRRSCRAGWRRPGRIRSSRAARARSGWRGSPPNRGRAAAPRDWRAAAAASCLLPPGSAVLIASKSRKSASCIVELVRRRDRSHRGRSNGRWGQAVCGSTQPMFPSSRR